MRYFFSVSLSLALCAGATLATAGSFGARLGESLPEFRCDQFNCVQVSAASNANQPGVMPQAISPNPVIAAPPPGQRLEWGGLAGGAQCVNVRTMNPQPTYADPYEYIHVTEIPVPLGSTHAALVASFESAMAGAPGGSGGNVGMLQIRRTGSSTWENVDVAYGFTIAGASGTPPILYGTGHYEGIRNLAQLAGPGQGSTPDAIDVRLGVFAAYTPAFSTILNNQACKGHLVVTF